jgi:hypothetical protein
MFTIMPAGWTPGPGDVEITSPFGIVFDECLETLPMAQPSARSTLFASPSGTALRATTRHSDRAATGTRLTVRVAAAVLLAGFGSAMLVVSVPCL